MFATSADLPIDGRAAITIRLPGLKAAGHLVQVLEARRRAGQRRLRGRQPMELVRLLVEHLGDRPELLLAIVVGHLEHRALGALDQVARRRLARQHAGLDLVGGGEQRAELGVVAHDLAVLAGVAGGRHPSGQLVDRRRPADLLELAALAQRLRHRQVVDLPVALVELHHRREHRAVLLAVEVLGAQMLLDEQRSAGAARPAAPRRGPTSRPPDCAAGRRCSGRRSCSIRV